MIACKICNGSGLLPFILPDGTTSIHSKVHCSCHPIYGDNPTEYLYESVPSDIDYPVSYNWYKYLCLQHGWPDPGSDAPETQREPSTGGETDKRVVEHIHRSSDLSKQEFRKLQDMEGQVKYLLNKVTELSKRKERPERY